jgi:hypothetical protein
MDQRLCLSVVVGFDYLAHSLSRVMERYIEIYNRPEKFKHLTKGHVSKRQFTLQKRVKVGKLV